MECATEPSRFSLECFLFKLAHDLKFTFLFILFCLIISYTIVVNLIVLVSILLDKLRNRLDICFISNAFADLLIGVFVLPILTVYSLFGYIPLGEFTCGAWISFDFAISTTSMLHFTYISYDRYLSVLKPVKYSSNNRHSITYLILFMLYLVSALCWIPLIFYQKNSNKLEPNLFSLNLNSNSTNYTELYSCSFKLKPLVIIPHALIVYLVPMLFIFAFYTRTIKMLNSKIRRRSSYSVSKISFSTKSNEDISDEKFSSIKKMTRDLFKLKKKSNESSIELTAPMTSVIQHQQEIQHLKSETINFEDEEEENEDREDVENEDKEDYILNKTVIVNTDSNRVKIFIKCKHFSDLTLNNVNIENAKEVVKKEEKHALDDEYALKAKRSAHSLNEVDLFRIHKHDSCIETKTNNLKVETNMNSTKSKSISEFKFNSNEHLNKPLNSNNNKSVLLTHIKQMGKKTIKFASMQSIRKKLSITNDPTLLGGNTSGRRASEFNVLSTQRRKSLTQREKNITYKLGLIMVLVLVSWVPFAILWPVSSLCLECIPNSVYFFSIWLTYANSLLSPLILISSNSKYSLLINLIKNVFYKK